MLSIKPRADLYSELKPVSNLADPYLQVNVCQNRSIGFWAFGRSIISKEKKGKHVNPNIT